MQRALLFLIAALAACRSPDRSTTPAREYELVALPAVLAVAGESKLEVWTYNGTVPGPTLRVKLGETLRVKVTNKLPQETTVHWHGVRLPNAMDGVPYLTQTPIQPGETFVYEFTPKDAGTFWYHPHVRSSEQVERGLYGLLIVEDPEPPPYSREVTWVLDDFRLLGVTGDRQIDPQFNTRGDLMHDGRWGNVITVNGAVDEVLRVRSGERLRMRLLNTANGRVFAPSFGDLKPKIIAVDGNYLPSPIPLERFELAPGNRLDLDLTIDIAASTRFEIVDRFYEQRPNVLAVIEVDGIADTAAPAFATQAHAVVPAWREYRDAKVFSEMKLDAAAGGPYGLSWRINGIAFDGHDHAHKPMLTMKAGEFHRLRFVNDSFRLHPLHIHGMFFRLLARNGAAASEEMFFRDTVLVHGKETIDIGVIPTELGQWMMHCHVLEHAEAGMMTTFEVR